MPHFFHSHQTTIVKSTNQQQCHGSRRDTTRCHKLRQGECALQELDTFLFGTSTLKFRLGRLLKVLRSRLGDLKA